MLWSAVATDNCCLLDKQTPLGSPVEPEVKVIFAVCSGKLAWVRAVVLMINLPKASKENGNDLTAVAAVKTYSIPYGTMEVEKDGLLKELKEKPTTTYYVNAGLYILEPHLLEEIPKDEFYHITHLMDKLKDKGGKVGVFPVSEGAWMDIGEINQYNTTKERFKNRFE